MNKTIGVLGCGWLGLPLAKTLIGDNHIVHGSTTSGSKIDLLKEAGIIPFNIVLSENGILGNIGEFLKGVDILIINVPPKLRSTLKESYIERMLHIHNAIKNTTLNRVIFISSTSVYGDLDGSITEDSPAMPINESGKQLLMSENVFSTDQDLNTTIIRFGGLIGPERHPVKFLSGKTDLSNGNDAINLIHLNDCIGIIKTVINGDYDNTTINGVYPYHPKKKEYYISEAIKRGYLPPSYVESPITTGNKIIKSKYLNVKTYQYNTSITS